MRKVHLALIIFTFFFTTIGYGQLSISLESGLVWNQYNDVQAPNGSNDNSTRFSFTDDFEVEQPIIFLRGQISYLINEKHRIELTAVPLTFSYDKSTRPVINFENQAFPINATSGTYQFNTYRASYRYRFLNRNKVRLEAGLSLLVRDAKIELSNGILTEENTDLGFVPLISFRLEAGDQDALSFLLAGDALVGPQGRAEDVFIGFTYPVIKRRLFLKAGYRVIEGGADVDQVYNFALFHFANVGVRLEL
ncbi:MAG: hypothetical protein AB8F94_19315 [Saprospiraceae bacterium]